MASFQDSSTIDASKVLFGAPRCSQSNHIQSHGTPIPVLRDLSYFKGRLECPRRADTLLKLMYLSLAHPLRHCWRLSETYIHFADIHIAWLGLEDIVSLLLPAKSGMVHWPAYKILWSSSISWWFPPPPPISLFHLFNSTITEYNEVESSLSISPCHDHELTPSTAYSKYTIILRSIVSHSMPVFYLSVDVVVLNSPPSSKYM